MELLFSFSVRLLHPLQHAGLSRRTPVCRPTAQSPFELQFPSYGWHLEIRRGMDEDFLDEEIFWTKLKSRPEYRSGVIVFIPLIILVVD